MPGHSLVPPSDCKDFMFQEKSIFDSARTLSFKGVYNIWACSPYLSSKPLYFTSTNKRSNRERKI